MPGSIANWQSINQASGAVQLFNTADVSFCDRRNSVILEQLAFLTGLSFILSLEHMVSA